MGRAKKEMEEVNRLEENKGSMEFDVSIRIRECETPLKLNVIEK